MRSFAWIVLLVVIASAHAQDKLTLTIDRTIIGVGESVNLTLTLSGATSADDVQLPPMQNLQVVAGPYSSTSYEIINGRASSSVSWTYRLRATKLGREQVGPIELRVGNQLVTSNQVVVNIAKGTPRGSAPGSRGDESPDVFIRVVPDKSEAYQGEQITLTYKIYFAAQISQPEIVKLPSAIGFWVEELTVSQKQTLADEVVGGKAYKVGVLRKVALFPTNIGELTVEPMTISTKVQRESRRRGRDPFDIFNDPFFSLGQQLEPMQVESPAVTLRVKPLPTTEVPPGFAGAVGTYKLRASLDKPASKTNEAVTLTIQIDGVGNIKTLPEPAIMFPPDLEHYDPKSSEQIRRDQQRISGNKRFDYVVIARAPGDQVIPSITYAFFDPSSNEYSTVSTAPLTLSVEKGTVAVSGNGIPVANKRGVESMATDIAYIKTRTDGFVHRGAVPHESVGFWLLTAGPWIALAGLVVTVRRREDVISPRRHLRKVMKLTRAEMLQADKSLKAGNLDVASRHISQSLSQIVGALLGDQNTDLADPDLPASWTNRGFDLELLERILKIERDCDLIRFAPALADKTATRELLKRVREVVDLVTQVKPRVAA